MAGAGMYGDCSLAATLSYGAVLEPYLHPKPGGVTPYASEGGKSFGDFVLHATLSSRLLAWACLKAWKNGPIGVIASVKERYLREVVPRFKGNIAYGTFMLMAPLAVAIALSKSSEPEELVTTARDTIYCCTGRRESLLHYKILRRLSPSHLGRYRGELPDVASGGERDIPPYPLLLKLNSWDMVHRELAKGYPITLEAYRHSLNRVKEGRSVEEALLEALLKVLAEHGDTLIFQKYGGRAFKMAREEARVAFHVSERWGVRHAITWLERLWRGREWNPGAALDIVAVASGLLLITISRDASS
ncbi:triphosphoribosyl-dephospho-CoA synthase [Aeropyrum pernix]|nr:triphosphoribosyl-dephospho-CoA synthase [Aeropyrum pernix]